MSDCNQMNCRNMSGSYTRSANMMRNGQAGMMHTGTMRSGMPDTMSCGGMKRREDAMCQRGRSCGYNNDPLAGMALGIGYVPWQTWKDIYDTDKAIGRGTIFAELDKPFCGVRGGRRQ